MKRINPEAEKYINWIANQMEDPEIYNAYVEQFMERAIDFFADRDLVIRLTKKKLYRAEREYGSPIFRTGESPETDLEEIFEELVDGAFGWPSHTDYNKLVETEASKPRT